MQVLLDQTDCDKILTILLILRTQLDTEYAQVKAALTELERKKAAADTEGAASRARATQLKAQAETLAAEAKAKMNQAASRGD